MTRKLLALAAILFSTAGNGCAIAAIDSEIFRLEVVATNAARSDRADLLISEFIGATVELPRKA